MFDRKKWNTIRDWKRSGIKFYNEADEDYIYDYYINTHNCENCNKVFKNSRDRCLDHCHLLEEIRGVICQKCNHRSLENCSKVNKQIAKRYKQGFLWRFQLKRNGKYVVQKYSTNKEEMEEFRANWIDNNLHYFTYF
tara:strand:- start:434 stop:844 length:411 start_codon:yes stop_codon:yes gene_type:complete